MNSPAQDNANLAATHAHTAYEDAKAQRELAIAGFFHIAAALLKECVPLVKQAVQDQQRARAPQPPDK